MTAETLKNYTLKDLGRLAKKRGVAGWHAMRKEQLVKALLRQAKTQLAPAKKNGKQTVSSRRAGALAASVASRPRSRSRAASSAAAAKPSRSVVVKRLTEAKRKSERLKNLSGGPEGASYAKDRLIVMVRDAYWLHAYWELTRQGVDRAQAAMGQLWHVAKPVLRVFEVSGGHITSATEAPVRTIEIHGGVHNWYIDVADPPKSYRVDIGYLAPGRFFCLARSNIVTTPRADAADPIDKNWIDVAENVDKIYAMSGGYEPTGSNQELQELFEERLRRPMGAPLASLGGVNGLEKKKDFSFQLDAELIVYGNTEPDAQVTLQGDPVKLRPDGSFTVRFSLPNCRQVIPAVAVSADGLEQRTIVLAVERNTKTMEPLLRDGSEQ